MKGVAVTPIEKQGIAEKLSYKANDYGIALLSTRGFLTENAVDLSDLSELNGSKNAIVTDDDISGQVIAVNAPCKRIGIDFRTLDYLGINNKRSDLEEVYTPNNKHLEHIEKYRNTKFAFLSGHDFTYLKTKRIEIHAVLNCVGVDRFWEWILHELSIISPVWDYTRAIKIPQPYQFRSRNTWRVTELFDNRIAKIIEPHQNKEKLDLSSHDGFINNVSAYEKKIHLVFQNIIDKDKTTDKQDFDKDLDKFVKKYDNGEYEECENEIEDDMKFTTVIVPLVLPC
jgi:hypothetical protein